MNRTDEPKKQPVVFGVNGQRETLLPTTPAGDNTASYDSGFPPVTMILKAAGGLPPKGQDMNQILFELSALSRWFSAGAIASYDSTFSTAIGGYPKGAEVVGSDGTTRYLNTVDANTTNPNTGGAGWFNLTSGYLQTANNLSDIPSVPTALANLHLGTGLTGVVGMTRNAAMSVPAASATATFTADEIIVETALGGIQYRISNFSKTINLATTGAGGMDTGTAPASGYVALYAIYNPTTAISALLAVNATAAKVPEIYGGANMPAGYTASALMSVVPTNSSSLIAPLYQSGRSIRVPPTSIFTTTTASATSSPVSISAGAPKNALSISLSSNVSTSGSSSLFLNIYESSYNVGQHPAATTSTGLTVYLADIVITVQQTIYANFGPSATGFSCVMLLDSYTF